MLLREFKINFKSLLLFTISVILLFLIVYLIYPNLVTDENVTMINEMMASMSPEMLKAFNMDISSISSAFGWYKTEGYLFILLIGSIYAALLGSTIITKEESDKTIEFLYSKPISKNQILINKLICGFINIAIFIFCVAIFNLIGLTLSGELDVKQYLMLSISPIMTFYTIFILSIFVSLFFSKTKKTMPICISLVFVFYFFQIISSLSDKTEIFKYLTPFTLVDARNIILNSSINIIIVIISLIITIGLLFLVQFKYRKKEFL